MNPFGYQIRTDAGHVRYWREVDSLPFGPAFIDAHEAEAFACYLREVHATEPQYESLFFLTNCLRAFRLNRISDVG